MFRFCFEHIAVLRSKEEAMVESESEEEDMDANPDGSDLVSSDFRKRIWMPILMAVIW